MRIFHIATLVDWERARQTGAYTTSTVGRSLDDEGFLHASRREQVAEVFERYYRDVPDALVLLTIDTDLLEVPWREDQVGEQTYPHIYGPLAPGAVVAVQPITGSGDGARFTAPG